MNLAFNCSLSPSHFNSYRSTSWEEMCEFEVWRIQEVGKQERVGHGRLGGDALGGVGFSASWMLLSKKLTFLRLSFLICTIVAPLGGD